MVRVRVGIGVSVSVRISSGTMAILAHHDSS